MALYIKDNLVLNHCRSDHGIRLIMNWMVSKGDMPYLERLVHCILITTDCYSGDGLSKMSNAKSNIVTIPLIDSNGVTYPDGICINPFIIRKKRKKLKFTWDSNSMYYHGWDIKSDDKDNGYDSYKKMFSDDEYEIYDDNLTSDLRDFILTIPTLIRDRRISEVLQ